MPTHSDNRRIVIYTYLELTISVYYTRRSSIPVWKPGPGFKFLFVPAGAMLFISSGYYVTYATFFWVLCNPRDLLIRVLCNPRDSLIGYYVTLMISNIIVYTLFTRVWNPLCSFIRVFVPSYVYFPTTTVMGVSRWQATGFPIGPSPKRLSSFIYSTASSFSKYTIPVLLLSFLS